MTVILRRDRIADIIVIGDTTNVPQSIRKIVVSHLERIVNRPQCSSEAVTVS